MAEPPTEDATPGEEGEERMVLVVTLGRQDVVLFDPTFWEAYHPKGPPVPQRRVSLAEARALARGNLRALQRRAVAAEGRAVASGKRSDWTRPMTGDDLAARRVAAGLSQRDLADLAALTRGLLSDMEHGRKQASAATWDRLLGALARAEADPARVRNPLAGQQSAMPRRPQGLAARRVAAGFTQTTLAAAVGMTQGNLSQLERGVHQPAPATRARLEAVLGPAATWAADADDADDADAADD